MSNRPNRQPRSVTVPSGYRYKFAGTRNWMTASDERWDTVVGDEARGTLLGHRTIDGSRCAVVRLGGNHIVAVVARALLD